MHIKWEKKWYSWDEPSAAAVMYDSWKDLLEKEDYEYLAAYDDGIYEAGCLIEVDEFIPQLYGYKEFCTLKRGSDSERDHIQYGGKSGDLLECSYYLEEEDTEDIDKKFYGAPVWRGVPGDAEDNLPLNVNPETCVEFLRKIRDEL